MLKYIFAFSLLLLFLASCRQEAKNGEVTEKPEIQERDTAVVEMPTAHSYSVDFLMGKYNPDTHPDFTAIDEKYASRAGMYMQKAAYNAFLDMYKAAEEEGIILTIRSAARNFEHQKRIWEEKWYGERLSAGKNAYETYSDPVDRARNILLYSAMPGTSRHHWGTDIDLNSFDNAWFEEGEGKKLYDWMLEHAPRFGFCQPYTAFNEQRKTGYQEERWHWSYHPLSVDMTMDAKTLIRDEMISGFSGAETAREIGIVENYILGIHPDCLD